jgi:hypothetical protein
MRRMGVGVAVVLAAGAGWMAAPAVAAARTITLQARSQLEQAQAVDNEPAGPSAGDMLVFTERLLDASGKRIGSDRAVCVRLFDATSLCLGTYKLRGGQVMVQLHQPGPEGTYDQAITGGTGRYAGARGTVTVRQSTGGDRFTFRILVG